MTTDAKTEAEAFLKLQEAANAADEVMSNVSSIHDEIVGKAIQLSSVFRLFAESTALPRLTLELVAENERLREAMRPFAEAFEARKECHLSDDPTLQEYYDENRITPRSDIGMWRRLWLAYQQVQALQEPSR